MGGRDCTIGMPRNIVSGAALHLAKSEASNRLFIRLVRGPGARGIRVILDGVFNHCGSFNKWMDREKIYENQEGYAPGRMSDRATVPYTHYFRFQDENQWPDNGSYEELVEQ